MAVSFAQFSLTQIKDIQAEVPTLSTGSEKLGDLWKQRLSLSQGGLGRIEIAPRHLFGSGPGRLKGRVSALPQKRNPKQSTRLGPRCYLNLGLPGGRGVGGWGCRRRPNAEKVRAQKPLR